MTVIKKSNWGGSRAGAGRKPRTEYESREIFKSAFDNVFDPEKMELLMQEAWDSRNWNMIKFFIEQRIGKAVDVKVAQQPKRIRIILGDKDTGSLTENTL